MDLGDLLIIDIPGFGKSENILPHLNVAQVGEAILSLARSLGWREFKVLGHSMGGFLTLDMASRNPQGLVAIAVISGFYFTVVETAVNPWRTLLRSPGSAGLYLGFSLLSTMSPRKHPQFTSFYDRLLPIIFRGIVAHPRRMPPEMRMQIASAGDGASFKKAAHNAIGYNPKIRWAQIKVLVTAIGGAEDMLVPPADLRELGEQTLADPHLISDAGHFSHLERPAQVLAALTKFNCV